MTGPELLTLDEGVLDADIAVVGAGPAGMAAAARAAEGRRSVVVLDECPEVGGQIWRHRPGTRPPRAARRWVARLARSGATVIRGASVVDAARSSDGAHFTLAAERDGRVCRVRAAVIVLATGARERFLPFPGWTLPGVVGIGGAQALLKAGTPVAGQRVVIAGSGPLLLPVADALTRAGARLALVAEQAPARALARFTAGLWRTPGTFIQAARHRAAFFRTRYAAATWVTAAGGDDRVREVTLTDGHRVWREGCDLLCTGYGLVPNAQLAHLLGCRTSAGSVVVDPAQESSIPGVFCAGEPTGVGGVDLALIEGEVAGLAATGRRMEAARLGPRRDRARAATSRISETFALRPELLSLATPQTIVCRCEDVRLEALRREWSPRQAKLYTRAGMGACQGRVCGTALECLFGWSPDTVRPPIEPVLLTTLLADADPGAAAHITGAS